LWDLCGAKLDLSISSDCPNCGTKKDAIKNTSNASAGKSYGIWIWLILIVLLLVGGYYFMISTNHPVQTSSITPSSYNAYTPYTLVSTPTQVTGNLQKRSGMKTIATISGQSSLTSNNIYIPSGYWELWYTADPMICGGQGQKSSKGSNSVVFPSLSIQVMDADHPNDIVETITPPGGLDSILWQRSGIDPRPWSQKFFQGGRNYYFIVNARSLNSYSIDIRIPDNS
jgi:hypothetical protein